MKKGNPLLGICLGMQLLLTKSEEFGKSLGLSIIKGIVKKIKKNNLNYCKIPVIGWHPLIVKRQKNIDQFNAYKILNKKNFILYILIKQFLTIKI